MTRTMTQPEMAAFDARELALCQEMWKIEDRLPAEWNLIHQHAGDKLVSNGYGRPKTWGMSDQEARSRVAGDLLARIEDIEDSIEQRRLAIAVMEEEFARQGRWTRYFPCLNRDGHIHASLRGCPTVRFDTAMGWATQMSGLTADEAIHGIEGQFEGLGETLCSVCFPEAPAQWCRTRSEVTKEERAAAKAAKDEARFVKRLRDGERFKVDGWWIETVAGCLQLLRDEVEMRDYYGHGVHPSHEAKKAGAEEAKRVLLAREAARPGTGATQEKIDDVIAKAVIRNRKDGARI